MTEERRFSSGDLAAIGVLVASTIVIGWPIIRGGYLSYIDNSVHLAEIHDLATGAVNGWSEISFSGFPLDTLHSPIWYTLLSTLTPVGLVDAAYVFVLCLGFVAPPLALYAVARRRTTPLRAGLLSFVLLVQPSMIAGIGSPFGGMFTHAFGAAGVILLADLLARERLTPRQHWLAAVLLCLIALTHLFALVAAVLVIGVTGALLYREDKLSLRELLLRGAGWAVAAIGSAAYWLTFLLTANPGAAPHDAMVLVELVTRFFVPSDAMFLLDSRVADAIRYDLYLTDALPIALLFIAGVGGFFRPRHDDRLARAGFVMAAFLTVALLVQPYWPVKWLGPVSWRFLYWVRVGLALSAIPLFAKVPLPGARALKPAIAAAYATIAVGSSSWWGKPLRNDIPPTVDMSVRQAKELWAWLESNADPAWGRIYAHDTFGQSWKSGGMSYSHLLAITPRYSRLPQMGVYYGVVPYTTRWQLSEFNKLYGKGWRPMHEFLALMRKTNAGVFLASSYASRDFARGAPELEELFSAGRYSLWRLVDAKNEWISPLRPTNRVSDVEWSTARYRFKLRTEFPRARVLLKSTYHPWWRVRGVPDARTIESPEGFLVVDNIGVGEFDVEVAYEPDMRPYWISYLGWALILAWGVVLRVRPDLLRFES